MANDDEAFQQIVAGLEEESEMATHIHIIIAPPDSTGYRAILSIDATEDDPDVVLGCLHRAANAWTENAAVDSDMFEEFEDSEDGEEGDEHQGC